MMKYLFNTILLLSSIVLLTACSSNDSDQQNLNSKFGDLIERVCRETGVPGASVHVISPQHGEFSLVWGFAELSTRTPVVADQRFRIGSLTKSFTGTAVLRLAEDGFIDIDAPISTYLASLYDYEPLEQITVRQLLTMSSGLNEYLNLEFLTASVLTAPLTYYPAQTLVNNALNVSPQLLYDPGTQFTYNNTNYILLGQLIETVSGKTYQNYLQETFFNPLALNDTFVQVDDSILENMTHGYYDYDEDGAYEDWTTINMSYVWSAGCLTSTARDVAIWMEALGQGTLLSEPFHPDNFQGQPITDGVVYGAGILVDDNFAIGHNGTVIGFHADAWYDPQTQTTVAVLCNTNAPIIDDERDPTREITEGILKQLKALELE
ncbi:MAG: serine hydrolase domain-containing protein [Desulfuromonas sp.]|nr:serine hydrolase domain-containing protein [Desulfuromonas sp.]